MRAAREALGLGQGEYADQYGLNVRTYRKNETGINEAGICLAAVFIRAGINANWLLTGDGPMRLDAYATAASTAHTAAEPPAPYGPSPIDERILAICIQGILEANPKATPARVARLAVEFYDRLKTMEAAKPEAA